MTESKLMADHGPVQSSTPCLRDTVRGRHRRPLRRGGAAGGSGVARSLQSLVVSDSEEEETSAQTVREDDSLMPKLEPDDDVVPVPPRGLLAPGRAVKTGGTNSGSRSMIEQTLQQAGAYTELAAPSEQETQVDEAEVRRAREAARDLELWPPVPGAGLTVRPSRLLFPTPPLQFDPGLLADARRFQDVLIQAQPAKVSAVDSPLLAFFGAPAAAADGAKAEPVQSPVSGFDIPLGLGKDVLDRLAMPPPPVPSKFGLTPVTPSPPSPPPLDLDEQWSTVYRTTLLMAFSQLKQLGRVATDLLVLFSTGPTKQRHQAQADYGLRSLADPCAHCPGNFVCAALSLLHHPVMGPRCQAELTTLL